ncbi:hypothetical protein CLAFUW4_00068 [Fulvia fulva]|uniref:Uncharacterized protein n=1 Tax=Passalora fulva TaxID=5499 RepID=A0A9Q8P328_PASFU|nr:uncharacterized protein CLAFUR5_00066 [Fulvia fulva]KAK4635504.1 hypothetical protein CLAFUR4_00068 [Fulvia fulva]KAK4637782.1 hypothetical protein CLAFUR0_00067 [Fulvia fulva]UJO11565.1 hypothetical protein CLAFUR5_00066 [Fulvia fulva]WPV09398.1 hypothetical protein CLAFUW4_00068 [Fulvia fulva]WPV23316.1 hypothetical protein CLAFUW7_00068 [Fulvia fulva]
MFQCSIDEGGQNFLHIAAETGTWRIIYVLVRCFATHHAPLPLEVSIPRKSLPVQPDNSGNTPLHIAAIHDHLDLAKALIRYYDEAHITDVLDLESPTKLDGIMIEPMSTFEMDGDPRLRFLLDCKNHEGLSASQAGFAAGATTTANWLHNSGKQGFDGIELVAAEEADLWFHSLETRE